MKIYTTYFAKVKKLPENVIPISIAAKTPDVKMKEYKKLAPPWYILKTYKDNGNEEEYVKEYNRVVLNNLNPKKVVEDLACIAQNKSVVIGDDVINIPCDLDVALVCYEKSGDFCHRHLVADWLNKNGFAVEEWDE